jgi:hypothetical protein
MIPLFTDSSVGEVAARGFPQSVRTTREISGSLAVLDGDPDWSERALDAVASGAGWIVVHDPHPAPLADLTMLRDAGSAAQVPITIGRRWVHAAPETPPPPRASFISADLTARPHELRGALMGALAWLGFAAQSDLVLGRSRSDSTGVIAEFEAAVSTRTPLALSATIANDQLVRARFHIDVVGAERWECTFDDGLGMERIVIVSERGRLELPMRFADPLRRTLARAIDSVQLGGDLRSTGAPDDIDVLIHHARLCDALIASS